MSASSTRWLAVIALALTFFAGAVVGFVADRAMIIHGRSGPPHPSAEFLVRRLDRRLHFTEEQRVQVIAIVQRGQSRIAHVWSNVRPSVHREIEATNVEIERVLTPEQRIEFAKIRMRLMPRRPGDGIRFKHD